MANCPNLICNHCASGETEIPQIGPDGCFSACPSVKIAQLKKCSLVECENDCYDKITPVDEMGCEGCPYCQRKQPTNCPIGLCRAPVCPLKTYINYYSSNCCKPNYCNFECQPKKNCPYLECLECGDGEKEVLRTDQNGCYVCPTCELVSS